MSHTEDIRITLAKLRAIHDEQTRRLIEQVVALKQIKADIEPKNKIEVEVEKETVGVWTDFLKNLK